MSVTTSRSARPGRSISAAAGIGPTLEPARHQTAFRYVMGAIRLSIGWVFLWAFLDKLFGLGRGTASKDAWINGGHPTLGFLKFASTGPLAALYHGIAGSMAADWLFMLGLAGIGIALAAGVAMRIAAVAGALLFMLMWSAVLPPATNPFIDDHVVHALTLLALMLVGAGHTLGLGHAWERLEFVRRYPILK